MDRAEEIKKALYDSHRLTADMVASYVGADETLFSITFELSFSEPYPMGMRAARVCQLCCEKNSGIIVPYLDILPDYIASSKIDGVKRSFLKIYADYLPYTMFRNIDRLTQLCFDMLGDLRESIAVRAYCMETAFKLCKIIPDLSHELIEIARFELESPSCGMQAKSKQILDKLKKYNSSQSLKLADH